MTKREVIKFTLEPEDLLELGKEGDTSIENMLAFIEVAKNQ